MAGLVARVILEITDVMVFLDSQELKVTLEIKVCPVNLASQDFRAVLVPMVQKE